MRKCMQVAEYSDRITFSNICISTTKVTIDNEKGRENVAVFPPFPLWRIMRATVYLTFINSTGVSRMRFEKTPSLSSHDDTFTSRPHRRAFDNTARELHKIKCLSPQAKRMHKMSRGDCKIFRQKKNQVRENLVFLLR